jgi:hypothetical protein
MAGACGYDQIIVANVKFRGFDNPPLEVEADDLSHENFNIVVPAQNGADGCSNFPGRKTCRRHLIQQGLKSVMILAIDHRDVSRSLGESLGRVQAAETRAHNHHARQPVVRHLAVSASHSIRFTR